MSEIKVVRTLIPISDLVFSDEPATFQENRGGIDVDLTSFNKENTLVRGEVTVQEAQTAIWASVIAISLQLSDMGVT